MCLSWAALANPSDRERIADLRGAVSPRQSFVLAHDGESFLFNPSAGVWNAPFLSSVYKAFGFSYDSRYFLYLKSEGKLPRFHLYVYDLDTGVEKQVSTDNIHFASWSPSSLNLAFFSMTADNQVRLSVHDFASWSSQPVYTGMLDAEFIEWSPDGSTLR